MNMNKKNQINNFLKVLFFDIGNIIYMIIIRKILVMV